MVSEVLHQELQRLKETRKALKAELREQSKEHRNITARRKRLLQAGLKPTFQFFWHSWYCVHEARRRRT